MLNEQSKVKIRWIIQSHLCKMTMCTHVHVNTENWFRKWDNGCIWDQNWGMANFRLKRIFFIFYPSSQLIFYYVHGFFKQIKQVERKKILKIPYCHKFLDFVGDIKMGKILSQLVQKSVKQYWFLNRVKEMEPGRLYIPFRSQSSLHTIS